MGLVVDERALITGAKVTGSGTTYTLASVERLRLELLTFTLTASATVDTRAPLVTLVAQSGEVIADLSDLNDVLASMVVVYTFGIGLEASCGLAANGGAIYNALPDTWLEPGTEIQLSSVAVGAGVVADDVFTNVALWGVSGAAAPPADAIPLLTPLALNAQAAA